MEGRNKLFSFKVGSSTLSNKVNAARLIQFPLCHKIDFNVQYLLASDFYATAACYKIKGNDSNYLFPYELINQVCDNFLRMKGPGEFKSRWSPEVDPNLSIEASLTDFKLKQRRMQLSLGRASFEATIIIPRKVWKKRSRMAIFLDNKLLFDGRIPR